MLDLKTISNTDRGQVGIGTLIVFIALVLVAAVAAAVLIGVADDLQDQGEQTSSESIDEVSNQVRVTSVYGLTNSDGDVEELNFNVSKASGASDIDLQRATIDYLGPDGQEVFTFAEDQDTPEDDEFVVEEYNDVNDSLPVLTERDDQAKVIIELNDSGFPGELSAGEEFEFTIVTEGGASTTNTVIVPSIVDEDSTVKLK